MPTFNTLRRETHQPPKPAEKTEKKRKAYATATLGRVTVSIHRRKPPRGIFVFRVANYSARKRRFIVRQPTGQAFCLRPLDIQGAWQLENEMAEAWATSSATLIIWSARAIGVRD